MAERYVLPEPRGAISEAEHHDAEPLIVDKDLPLHSFASVTIFMRRRSAWLCVAGASLAYFAFVPPLLVVVPSPLSTLRAPPVCTVLRPDSTLTAPPVPLVPLPTLTSAVERPASAA